MRRWLGIKALAEYAKTLWGLSFSPKWKNWVKEVTANGETAYTFLLPLNIEGMKMTLELAAVIWQKSYDKLWKVIFYNAHPHQVTQPNLK